MRAGAVGDVLGEGVAGVGGVVGEVGVDVDRHPEALGQREDPVDVLATVLERGLLVAAAPDDVGARAQALGEEVLGAGRPQDPLLREGHHLQVDEIGVVLAQCEHRLESGEPDDRVDVGLGADHRRAVGDGLLEQTRGPGGDRLPGEGGA